MRLLQVSYRNFRNVGEADVTFAPDVTFFAGDNGLGKTNLLEGIYFFASGRSFRTVHDSELIRRGERYASLTLTCESEQAGKRTLAVRWDGDLHKRVCLLNGVPVSLMSEWIGSFRAVLFCPQHLSLVCDGPGARRGFLDVALSQADPLYLASLRRYYTVLAQRNALIKSARDKRDDRIFTDTQALWAVQLAHEAAILAEKRFAYVARLSEIASGYVSDMTTGREQTVFTYKTPRTEEEYLKLLTENQEYELRSGCTQYGIHKDDIAILLKDTDARSFASRGQQRSIALAMKLAEGDLSRAYTGEYPVFLFDDVLSELDQSRRRYLLDGIGSRQVVLTSCEPYDGFQGKLIEVGALLSQAH